VTDPDCVVVGGGLAGIVAANRLAEQGLHTRVLERGPDAGGLGNARLSGGFLHIGWLPMDAPPEQLEQRVREATSDYIQPDLAIAFARNAGRAVAWLKTQDVEVLDRAPVDHSEVGEQRKLDHEVHTLAPRDPAQVGERHMRERGPDRALRRLYAAAVEKGCEISLGSGAHGLAATADGRWEIRYTTHGQLRAVTTAAVLVSDGGFATNREMLARYVGPNAGDCLRRSSPGSTGAGLSMLMKVGAGVTNLGRVYGHMVSRSALENDRLWPHPTVDDVCLKGLLVGRSGQRYATAAKTGVALVNELVRTEDPRGYSVIMDRGLWETVGRQNPTGDAPNPTIASHGGTLFEGDVDAVARAMGSSAAVVRRAIDEHNADPGTGTLAGPRYYVLPVVPGLTLTMGGARVDAAAAVLDQTGAPIPGLWAAGSVAGGIQGGPNGGYVGGLSAAIVFGLLAAEAMARSVRSTAH
jgi:fumarate reductase flavoprotein subunit